MVIGFIGAGKMARALARGLVNGGIATGGELFFSFRSPESAKPMLNLFAGEKPRWTSDNLEVVQGSDLIVLAIKPPQFAEALPPLRDAARGKLFLSVAAGITLDRLQALLGPGARI